MLTQKLAVRAMPTPSVQLCVFCTYMCVVPVALFIARRRSHGDLALTTAGAGWSAASALLAVVAAYSFSFAIQHRPVSQVMSITQCYPILSFVLCWMVLREPVSPLKVVGAVVMVLGCAIMNH